MPQGTQKRIAELYAGDAVEDDDAPIRAVHLVRRLKKALAENWQ
jgi:hypothetical protein